MADAKDNVNNQFIRPPVDSQIAINLSKKLYGVEIKKIKELNGYDDRNFVLTCSDDQEYVLKVTNTEDSAVTGLLEAQNEMILFLHRQNFHVPVPIKNIYGHYIVRQTLPNEDANSSTSNNSTENKNSGSSNSNQSQLLQARDNEQCYNESTTVTCPSFAIRLLKFVPGIRLCDAEIDHRLLIECGEYLASLNLALNGFENDNLRKRKYLWSLKNAPEIKKFLYVIENESRRNIIEQWVESFENNVLARIDQLEHAFIHGDFNEQNILINRTEKSVAGIIDFGDICYGPRLFDIAILITYIMIMGKTDDPILVAPNLILKGYTKLIPLQRSEVDLIMTCSKARLCQSLVLGAYTHSLYPENEYLLATAAQGGWKLLDSLHQIEQNKLIEYWIKSIC